MTALRFNSSKPHGGWTPAIGSAAFAHKHGRIQPMEQPSWLAKIFGRNAR